ncbi:hypothetical protein TorRG33x02_040220 [Trema orientale]|uniref:Uncharacterized protein n=1 Tax=Trema orientale TaxID=63057 RepID=A0A2P5FR55_TREOI|nr:hypothetical protein TorRG33x02_040220 [Trema orientale]
MEVNGGDEDKYGGVVQGYPLVENLCTYESFRSPKKKKKKSSGSVVLLRAIKADGKESLTLGRFTT